MTTPGHQAGPTRTDDGLVAGFPRDGYPKPDADTGGRASTAGLPGCGADGDPPTRVPPVRPARAGGPSGHADERPPGLPRSAGPDQAGHAAGPGRADRAAGTAPASGGAAVAAPCRAGARGRTGRRAEGTASPSLVRSSGVMALGHPRLPGHRLPAHGHPDLRARHPRSRQRLQPRQHAAQHRLQPGPRRHPDQRHRAAAGQRGQAGS